MAQSRQGGFEMDHDNLGGYFMQLETHLLSNRIGAGHNMDFDTAALTLLMRTIYSGYAVAHRSVLSLYLGLSLDMATLSLTLGDVIVSLQSAVPWSEVVDVDLNSREPLNS